MLVSSAGRRVALMENFRESLRAAGFAGRVLAADMSAVSAAMHVADGAVLVPPCTDPDFAPCVLELCREQGIRLVVPTIDAELPVYAAHRQRFADHGISVAVSSPEVIALATDKVTSHRWLADHGFPVPGQASVPAVLDHPARWPYPVLVKPRHGNSARGVAVVGDLEQLLVATRGGGFLVQTVAAGFEHTIDLLVDRAGRCQASVPRRRLEVRAGEVSKAVTIHHQGLEQLGLQIAEALPGAYGPLNVQVFADEDALQVIELNPRFGGGYPLSWRAGADFARWLVEDAAGRQPTAVAPWRSGVVMLRYDDAVFVPAERVGL